MARWQRAAATALLLLAPATAAAELPPLIPRTVLFGNPEKIGPQISPDGRHLAYVAPDGRDVLQVWVRTVGKEDDRKLTDDPKRGIRQYYWAYDGEHLLYMQDRDGDENDHVHAVSLKTGKVRDLTPFDGVKAQGVDLDPAAPNYLIVGLNRNDPRKFDAYRINLKTGKVGLEASNPGNVVGWLTDDKFHIRGAVAKTPDGGTDMLLRDGPGDDWKKARHWGPDDNGAPLAFTDGGKALYFMGSHDANTNRLLKLDLATGKETVVAEDPEYDLTGALIHPTKRRVQAAMFQRDKLTWKVLDPDIEEDIEALKKLRRGQFALTTVDLADRTWLVAYTTDDGPVYYYAYDRPSKKATLLFSHQPRLEKVKLARMEPVSYKSRDGLTVHGYLTLPPGVPAKNLPAVLLVHGGPWARDSWGYSALSQWLANRGYAVLQVNFRGSTGYGKKFLNAGNREWAGKMHDDLIDGVNWLVERGTADPKRVGIMGGSYGGYATLVGLTWTPDVFACGVDIVGPSNLVTLLKSIPPYWGPMKSMFNRRVGDVEKEEKFLTERSPLHRVDKIRAPLLIGQGANDPRVKQAESDQIYDALKKAGRKVQYVIYTDEGHGFVRPENRLHFFAIAEAFLAEHLGGRAEPAGEVKGHSAVIR